MCFAASYCLRVLCRNIQYGAASSGRHAKHITAGPPVAAMAGHQLRMPAVLGYGWRLAVGHPYPGTDTQSRRIGEKHAGEALGPLGFTLKRPKTLLDFNDHGPVG